MIKRLGGSIAAVGLLLTLVPAAVSAAPAVKEFNGPDCLDIASGAGTLTGTTVAFDLTIGKASCKNVSYTMTALSAFPAGLPVGSQTLLGDASTVLHFSFPVTDTDGTVCVVGTTTKGGKIADRAPDEFCLELVDNSGASGGQGFH
jgi:hypothetical protein